FLRPERLYLIPGDSPMGFRLPLDSLPWVAPDQFPRIYERDPFDTFGPLPGRDAFDRRFPEDAAAHGGLREGAAYQPGRMQASEPRFFSRGAGPGREGEERRETAAQDPSRPPARFQSDPDVVRTALCVEPRDGILHIFLPPIQSLEDFLDLSAAIESTAQELGQKVRLEGYHPPNDQRLGRFQVTPDPGVIEVNIQPAGSWNELTDITTGVYEDARQIGLRSEKFMVDGRHVGSGGGNHVVVGAGSPNDSPFLRRPDLLRSMVGYWINHPALSYLFSGLFVGPTSQAPRVDEARHDSLYELELAFRQLDAGLGQNRDVPPWIVDRLFRNLLVDITGNTHRTEFCIDKLYSPDSSSGRLGLVELRSFEMPPHARMSLVQQLLVRSLISAFWKEPYRERAVRWGTELSDRYALPHFVRVDFEDVIEDLKKRGYDFDPAWFDPHHEFRFPLLGTLETRGGTALELRQAIEPWNVLGEENTGSGTARFVDSSVERIEVKVRGGITDRHIVTCNGRRVPLRATGTNGEFVAGVRYRAWHPPSALHPLINVHSPLVFDIFDRW
ncbi:MAG TPA: transglutaminase family protein, partial [Polyangiaceae bacterium]